MRAGFNSSSEAAQVRTQQSDPLYRLVAFDDVAAPGARLWRRPTRARIRRALGWPWSSQPTTANAAALVEARVRFRGMAKAGPPCRFTALPAPAAAPRAWVSRRLRGAPTRCAIHPKTTTGKMRVAVQAALDRLGTLCNDCTDPRRTWPRSDHGLTEALSFFCPAHLVTEQHLMLAVSSLRLSRDLPRLALHVAFGAPSCSCRLGRGIRARPWSH